jgi:uncharacterized protein YndB with AHSA1/START domain
MSESKPIAHRGRSVRKQIETRATPEQVWEAWADPKKLSQWFVDDADGEAKAGSSMTWIFEDFGYRFPYEVVEALPGKRLVLSGPEGRRPPFVLEINIQQEGGQTSLKLVQSGFQEGAEWDDEYHSIDSGWQMALAVLKHYLENYFDRPRRRALVMQEAEYSSQRLHPFYREEEGLARWLTRSGRIGQPGEGYELVLSDGAKMSGRVLADTGNEVQLSWREIEGVLALKAFSMGPERRIVAIDALSWGIDQERLQRIKQTMTDSLERLKAVLAGL